MTKFIIEGGHRLQGAVEVSGAKNAAIKIVAASLLATKPVVIENVPRISDIDVMIGLVKGLDVKATWQDQHTLILDPTDIKHKDPDHDLVKKLRASVLLAGPLLSRFKALKLPLPGGDQIGRRPIDTHLDGLKQLGAKVENINRGYHISGQLKPGNVFLQEMSVTATETVMLAATLIQGTSTIHGAASEPEIVNLAQLLDGMGAKVEGAGSPTVKVTGKNKLGGGRVKVIPDRIETATLLMAGLVTKGQVTVSNCIPEHLGNFIPRLKQMGANIEINVSKISASAKNLKAIRIDTRPYPGFSTDLQSPMATLMTQAKGTSQIFETLFDDRFNYVPALQKMGADIKIIESHTLQITGPTNLKGKTLISHDIRDGAALVLAALAAQGQSIITNVELIDRGYEKIDVKLAKLGAKVKRVAR